jgi:hypothetical protein
MLRSFEFKCHFASKTTWPLDLTDEISQKFHMPMFILLFLLLLKISELCYSQLRNISPLLDERIATDNIHAPWHKCIMKLSIFAFNFVDIIFLHVKDFHILLTCVLSFSPYPYYS